MKVCVIGSRSISSFDLTPYIPNETELLITGGAKGIDTMAEEYADKHGISKLIVRPNYRLYGHGAPLKRNEIMIDLADVVLAVWDGASRGTAYGLQYAEKRGKHFLIIPFEKQRNKKEPI